MKKLLLISFFCLSSGLFADECKRMQEDCDLACTTAAQFSKGDEKARETQELGCKGCCQRSAKKCRSTGCNNIFQEAETCPFSW
ncbi:MAG TPA: hypothetical protein VJ201_09130 [Candidatus Babeliales bacterium]|nr:hypothetical protein [Candidatus Babeliales bacterium]